METLADGNAHVWNCFLPRDGSADLRLFDWNSRWLASLPGILPT